MRRREVVTGLGASAVTLCAARPSGSAGIARQVAVLDISAATDPEAKSHLSIVRESLDALGWKEGENLQLTARWAGGDSERVRQFAKELVSMQPEVILGRSTPVIRALRQESRVVPIVFVVVSDPVGEGFAATLSRPGGNATGFTNVEASLPGKWVEFLKELAPSIRRAAIFFNPDLAPGGGAYYLSSFEPAAVSLGIRPSVIEVRSPAQIEAALGELASAPDTGVVVAPDGTTTIHRKLFLALAARYRMPAIFAYRYIAGEGGLLSYGVDVADLYRRAATYVDRILKGEKPADLPVQQPTKFELAVNLKTAKALGITIPATLLARADEVIE